MNLDADRLAQLAGLPATNRRNLSETANSSLRDEPALSDEQDHRFGKGQIAEEYGGNRGDKIRGRGEDKRGHRHGDKAYVQEMDHPSEGMHYEGKHEDADEAMHVRKHGGARKIAPAVHTQPSMLRKRGCLSTSSLGATKRRRKG